MSLTGDGDRPPLVTGGSQAQYLGGLNAFGAAATAWLGSLVHGRGRLDRHLPAGGRRLDGRAVRRHRLRRARCSCAWATRSGPCGACTPASTATPGVLPRAPDPGPVQPLDDPELVDERFTDPLRRLDEVNDELLAKMYGFFADRTKADVLELGPPLQGAVRRGHDPRRPAGLARAGRAGVLRRPWRPGDGHRHRAGPALPRARLAGPAAVPPPGTDATASSRRGRATPRGRTGGLGVRQPPLEGVRVLDLTMMWAGPFATMRLAEMGAEIWKVESPAAWDNIRTLLPQTRRRRAVELRLLLQRLQPGEEVAHARPRPGPGPGAVPAARPPRRRGRRELPGRRARQAGPGLGRAARRPRGPGGRVDGRLRQGRPRRRARRLRSGDRDDVGPRLAHRLRRRGVPFKTGISYGDPVAGHEAVGGRRARPHPAAAHRPGLRDRHGAARDRLGHGRRGVRGRLAAGRGAGPPRQPLPRAWRPRAATGSRGDDRAEQWLVLPVRRGVGGAGRAGRP